MAHKTLDHAICVNTQDPNFKQLKAAFGDRVVAFEAVDPTTEVMARTIHDVVKTKLAAYRAEPAPRYPLRPTVRVVKVRLWETSCSWAEYFENPDD